MANGKRSHIELERGAGGVVGADRVQRLLRGCTRVQVDDIPHVPKKKEKLPRQVLESPSTGLKMKCIENLDKKRKLHEQASQIFFVGFCLSRC